MQAALNRELIRVDDYLAGEETSELKHEYIGGVIYARAGASREQNLIALNIYTALRQTLRGRNCRAFVSDVKLALNFSSEMVFYHPDVMVGCDPRDTHRLFLSHPRILVEVSSTSTERLDRHEKRSAYQTIEKLEHYLIVAQDRVEATLFSRDNHWIAETFNRLEQTVPIKSLDLTLPLATIYEGLMDASQ
jgi:Uma2 family endonuclease